MSALPNDIIYEEDFRKDVNRLPTKVQDKLTFLIEILSENPFDSRLHTKRLGPPLQGAFSFRIIRGYRAAFMFQSPHLIRFLMVDTRDNIYRRLSRKL